jgi:predicted phosphodiesterase
VNIQLLSDLHLETNPHFVAQPTPGADVLVLAGDIGSYQPGSALSRLGVEDFGLARFSPRPVSEGGAGWPCPVLFIPGNHEYDGQEFDAATCRLQAACALWTDFDALNGASLSASLAGREKAFRAANYYLRKNHSLRHGVPMLAPEVRELGLQSQAWLRTALSQPFDGSTVVVTHFAPSLLSADPRYGLTPGTAGFCNALDDLLPAAQLWLHGHLHCPQDYRSQGCHVVANPLGYAHKGEQNSHRPALLIHV